MWPWPFLRHTAYTPAQLQHLGVLGDLPLLSADVGVLDHPVAVDDEKPRPLPQGDKAAFHLVLVIDAVLRIDQQWKRQGMSLSVGLGVLQGVVDYSDDLRSKFSELPVLLCQLAEVPTAEWSEEPSEEHQDHATLPPIAADGELSSTNGRKSEVWSRRAYGDLSAGNRHTISLCLPHSPVDDGLRLERSPGEPEVIAVHDGG